MKRLFVVGIAGLALLASGWTQLRQIQFKHEVILQRTAYTPGATVNGVSTMLAAAAGVATGLLR